MWRDDDDFYDVTKDICELTDLHAVNFSIGICLYIGALKNNFIPATLNCKNENRKLNLNIVKENRKSRLNTIAKMSCGFAGFNGVCIFTK